MLLLSLVGMLAALVPTSSTPASATFAGEQIALGQWLSPPAALSTSGDFATDTFSDPWDFSNPEDVIPVDNVGTQDTHGISYANGLLNVATRDGSTIRLLFDWPHVLPWGRDGWAHPIDAGLYTQITFRMCADQPLSMAVRFENAFGQEGILAFRGNTGCQLYHFDLLSHGEHPYGGLQYPFPNFQGPWAGPIVRLELHRGGCLCSGNPLSLVQLDWVRVHRADAPQQPPANLPVPRVLTPNVEGGADYATVERGNAWDFNAGDDIVGINQVAGRIENGSLVGTTTGNDPFVDLALGPPLNTDRYRRMTVDACYDGGFSLADAPGGGMNGRFAWMRGGGDWTETQDFVIFPGCHRMTIDMVTNGALALHDEASAVLTGWRGMRPNKLRYDLNEDRGARGFRLNEIKLADDAAFSTTYPIHFADAGGSSQPVADIYVTTTHGGYSGTRIAKDIKVNPGTNTFTWNGTDANGSPMPNATYWVYITMRNAAGVGTGYSTGPVRLEKPTPPTPSYFVPLMPARVLDTRTGIGGNITPLGQQVFTELDVTGVGGVPETNVTAVVMNVTVDGPTAPGYLSVWPSGEPQPLVASLNFFPGQTVPNLVTVKTGANGRVNIFNSTGSTSVIADVMGYYTDIRPATGGSFTAVTPARILDTRDGTGRGGAVGPVPQGGAINVPVTGIGGVPPSGVTGVALNVTVDQPTGSGFLTVWPTGEAMPLAATHNFVPGLTVGNLVLAKVGAGGQVSIFNSSGNTHVVADVVGYFSSSGGRFVPVTPRRLLDTRDGTGGVIGQVGQGGTIDVQLATGNPVPPSATAVIVNVTSANSSLPSYVTAWPTGTAKPLAATMSPRPGVPVPNQAYLKLGPGGRLSLYNNSGETDLIVDVFGYIE